MNETYVECMVPGRTNKLLKFLQYFLIFLTVLSSVAMFITIYQVVCFLLAVALGAGAYFASRYANVEFEYLYVDKQITVDKIFNKERRKRVATYECEKMEIFAPIKSYKLDDYKNRQVKEIDYSSGSTELPDRRFVMYYDGKEKIIFEPNEAFVKALYNIAPRKVFSN